MLFSAGGVFVSPYNLLVWGGLAALIAAFFVSPAFRVRAAKVLVTGRAIILAYAIWVAWRLVCDVFGVNPSEALDVTFKTIIYLESPILLCAIYIRDSYGLFRLARVVVICCIFTALIGLYEWVNTTSVSRLVGWDMAAAGTEAARLMALNLIEQYRNGTFRAASVYNHPLVFSQLLACLISFSVIMISMRSNSYRLLGSILAVLIVVAIYISGTRSGFVVFGVAIISYIILSFLEKLSIGRIFAIFVALSIFWFLFGSPLFDFFLGLASGSSEAEQASSAGRDQQWILGLEALWNSPIFGYGDGQAVKLAGVSGRMDLRSIDSYYLATLLNFGVPGLLAFSALFVAIILRLMSMAASAPSQHHGHWFRGMASAMIALAVGFSVLAIPDNFVLIFAFAGCVLGVGASRSESLEPTPMLPNIVPATPVSTTSR